MRFKILRLLGISMFVYVITFAGMNNANGQTRISSPFSRFGVGELMFNNNFRNLGMGGLGVGYRSNISVNSVNPASYTAVDSTSFIFEATGFSHFYQAQTATQSQVGNYTSLSALSLSFPITHWWATAAGVKPFSAMGYKIRNQIVDPTFGNIDFLYEGSGGINQVFWGNAFRPLPGFSVGVNASYLFGHLTRSASVSSDSIGFFLTNQVKAHKISGWHFGFGAQYDHKFSENRYITLGIIAGLETAISSEESETIRRRLPGVTPYDTTLFRVADQGNFILPMYWGVGITGRINEQWKAGFEFQWQNWENYSLNNQTDNLVNTYRYAAGVRFRPTLRTFGGFFSRLEYSAGFRFAQNYLNLNNQPQNEFGISFGVFMPIRRTNNGINLGVEFGQRGSTENNLIQENLFRINLGVNIHERWFIRTRFF